MNNLNAIGKSWRDGGDSEQFMFTYMSLNGLYGYSHDQFVQSAFICIYLYVLYGYSTAAGRYMSMEENCELKQCLRGELLAVATGLLHDYW